MSPHRDVLIKFIQAALAVIVTLSLSDHAAAQFSARRNAEFVERKTFSFNKLIGREDIDAQAIKKALQEARWQKAEALADSALANYEKFSSDELAEIHALRALIFSQKSEQANAQAHLALALQLDANLTLDPIYFPPRMLSMFDELRPKIVTLRPADLPARYIFTPDRRVGAMWRSLVLPGWGQIYKGEKKRARIFMIAAGAMTAAMLTTHFMRQNAKNTYVAASTEAEAERLYKIFNRRHLARRNAALGIGVVWSLSFLDAVIRPVKNRP